MARYEDAALLLRQRFLSELETELATSDDEDCQSTAVNTADTADTADTAHSTAGTAITGEMSISESWHDPPSIFDVQRQIHFAHGIEWYHPSVQSVISKTNAAKRAHADDGAIPTCFKDPDAPITEADYIQMLKTHKRKRRLLFSASIHEALEYYHSAAQPGASPHSHPLPAEAFLPFLTDDQAVSERNQENASIASKLQHTIAELEDNVNQKLAEITELERKVAKSKLKSRTGTAEASFTQASKIRNHIAIKEVSVAAKSFRQSNFYKLTIAKKLAEECQKEFQRRFVRKSVKAEREGIKRARKMVSEMVVFWKRNEKLEKERRKKAERELVEQRKKEEEAREAKRQSRKFNFLITQTELYAHFMSKKLGQGADSEVDILQRLDADADEESGETADDLKRKALDRAQSAVNQVQQRAATFDNQRQDAQQNNKMSSQTEFDQQFSLANPNMEGLEEIEQPEMLRANLKGYQLKGMRWLSNLYQQGINGILADEMGLGKVSYVEPAMRLSDRCQTIQSIATVAHLAEKENIWGPFLVVAPASTLHNWCNELNKFTPDLKVLPYWGTQPERKVLRGFWNPRRLYRKDADFHVMVTSYEMIVQDAKHFARVNWQYMILDEAQAIKSSTSARWNTLLKFNCRNRLLLTGTPIQNTMAELWALLHFIMPTLFDSHNEFNEWFSKDIESHAQNSSSKLDQAQLHRLHMILKPFMLRRIKRNVEDELPDKVEVMIQCSLSPRQLRQYRKLKAALKQENLNSNTGTLRGPKSAKRLQKVEDQQLANLLNLVMQFRKVCNHPDLLNLRAVRSPFVMSQTQFRLSDAKPTSIVTVSRSAIEYALPRVIYDELLHPVSTLSDKQFATAASFKPTWALEIFRVSHRLHLTQYGQETGTLANILSAMSISPGDIDDAFQNTNKNFLLYSLVHVHQLKRNIHHTSLDLSPYRPMTIDSIYNQGIPEVFLEPYLDLLTLSRLRRRWNVVHPLVLSLGPRPVCSCSNFVVNFQNHLLGWGNISQIALTSRPKLADTKMNVPSLLQPATESVPSKGLLQDVFYESPRHFISHPDFALFLADCAKLQVLDKLLTRLKEEGHRVLIYSQMTRMIDLLEEFMTHRSYKYLRLDGSSKISERRDMVSDFQSRSDIFAFILSTRAGGIGINLTAADTVIFYDSDWNPTVDQQAMDRAHRLGQTRTVTVYRLITKNSVEERILERAQEKSKVHQMVIQGGSYVPERADKLKPTEVMAMLFDDDDEEDASQPRDLEEEEDVEQVDDEDDLQEATQIDIDAD